MNTKFNNYFFYHIYPLGFCDAPFQNDFSSESIPRLEKIYDWIEHIKSLNVNALYLGPVFESYSHGYDTIDYYKVDRRLGRNETLKKLIEILHQNNIDVILDGVFNHVGRKFFAFKDIQEKRTDSEYCGWISGLDFSQNNPFNDSFTYDTWNNHFELVKLNLNNYEVKKHLLGAVEMWIKEFNIDGLRLDAADCLDINFLKELSRFTKNIKPDFFLVGEVIHGDYNNWANEVTLDSVTNYEVYKGLYSSHNDNNYFEIAYSLNRQFGESGIYKNLLLYNFVDNHDVNRITSQLFNSANIYPLYCLLFTMPGIPSIYYGSEFGINGIKENNSDKNLRPSLELSELYEKNDVDLLNVIKKLSSLRNNLEALKKGNYTQMYINHKNFAFMRKYNDESVIVIVNAADKEEQIDIEMPLPNNTVFYDVLNSSEKFIVSDGRLQIKLYPNWGRILVNK